MPLNKHLTPEERHYIVSMSNYWNEVNERQDTSPLEQELVTVFNQFGSKVLWALEYYAKNTPD